MQDERMGPVMINTQLFVSPQGAVKATENYLFIKAQ